MSCPTCHGENLTWKKPKGTSRRKFTNDRMVLCQDSDTSWKTA